MNVASRALLGLAVSLSAVLFSGGAQAATLAYLKMDGRWYGITSADNFEFSVDNRTAFLNDSTAQNCRRPNGSAPSLGSTNSAIFAVGNPIVTIGSRTPSDAFTVTPAAGGVLTIITFYSLDGDIICNGEVPAPQLPLFANGFE